MKGFGTSLGFASFFELAYRRLREETEAEAVGRRIDVSACFRHWRHIQPEWTLNNGDIWRITYYENKSCFMSPSLERSFSSVVTVF